MARGNIGAMMKGSATEASTAPGGPGVGESEAGPVEAPAASARPAPVKSSIASLKALRAAARDYAGTAITTLASIAEGNESAASRIAAANAILDRGFGKARPEPEVDDADRPEEIGRIIHVIIDPQEDGEME